MRCFFLDDVRVAVVGVAAVDDAAEIIVVAVVAFAVNCMVVGADAAPRPTL